MFNKFKEKLKQPKTKIQITKLFETILVCLILLLFVEILFQIPAIRYYLSVDILKEQSGILIWVLLWLLMFFQCTILPIPAMPIYVFCNQTSLVSSEMTLNSLLSWQFLIFTFFCSSACILGSISAYWLGRKFGKKAIKWVAGSEEDYDKWSKILNSKWGKSLYLCTVMFPLFPDDILSIVVGAMKMNFNYYAFVHCLCKAIGIKCTFIAFRLPIIGDFLTSGTSGGIPWALIIYCLLTIICIVAIIIMKKKIFKNPV